MKFELSDRQKNIQWTASEFAKGEFDPDLTFKLDQARQFPESIWKKACQLGFIGVHFPKEFGGLGLGTFEDVLVIEAFCKVDSGIGSALSTVDLGSEIILEFGSHAQKEQFIPPLTKGEKRISVAFGESEMGDDISSISTIAERRGEEFIIHGRKKFVPNASLADTFIVLCKEPKESWITLMVERGEGIKVDPAEKMGLRMIQYGDLDLEGVRVPVERRIGGEGEGIDQVNNFRQKMRLRGTGQALGMVQGAFERAMQYAKQREAFAKKLSQFQVIRHKLAEMAVGIEVVRCLAYKSATEYDNGRMDPGSLSIAQIEIGRRSLRIVYDALQIFGGIGYMAEMDIEHYYRDAAIVAVDLGTEEELRDVIAEEILGPDGS